MIHSFKCKETEKVWLGKFSKKFPSEIQKRALRKLRLIFVADDLHDLKVPLSNQLEALVGDRKHQYSIRINKQWRICFKWTDGNADDVEIVDYH